MGRPTAMAEVGVGDSNASMSRRWIRTSSLLAV